MKKIFAILLTLAVVFCMAAYAEGDQWAAGLKIGLAQMHYTNAYRTAETNSVLTSFEGAGAEVVWNEAGNDTATQVANVKDLLTQDIDYLLRLELTGAEYEDIFWRNAARLFSLEYDGQEDTQA